MSFSTSGLPTYRTLWQERRFPIYGPWAHPYYIWTPNYCETSAGIRVLHYLCHILNSVGYEAYVWPGASAPHLRASTLTQDIVSRHSALGLEPIVLYPEIVEGNPLNARVIARYLLYFPGFHSGKLDYGPSELLFSYLDDYVPDGLGYRKLFIPCTDTALFDSHGAARNDRGLTAFYANRFLLTGQPLVRLPGEPIELSPRVAQRSLAELADLFRHARVLYAYEWSSICVEAMLCGCPVVLVPNSYLEGHLSAIPRRLGHQLPSHELYEGNGLCLGVSDEAVATAAKTVGAVRDVYAGRSIEAVPQLETFVRVTQAVARRMRSRPDTGTTQGPGALHESWGRFRSSIDAADHKAAKVVGAQIEHLLGLVLAPEVMSELRSAGTTGRSVQEAGNDDLLALAMMLKPSGYCFLRAQHLLSVTNAPAAAAQLFRLAGELCEQNLDRSVIRFADYQALLANAMFQECVALNRSGRLEEARARAEELLRKEWSSPMAASIRDGLRAEAWVHGRSSPR